MLETHLLFTPSASVSSGHNVHCKSAAIQTQFTLKLESPGKYVLMYLYESRGHYTTLNDWIILYLVNGLLHPPHSHIFSHLKRLAPKLKRRKQLATTKAH